MLPPRSMLKTRVRPGLAMSRSRAIEEEDERFNPIRPSNGNVVMRGGADVVRSSRTPRLSMADSRAMEIQRRNEIPGTGATPVMGVSEYRGGAMERYVGGAMERCVGAGGKKKAVAAGGVASVEEKLRKDPFLVKCYGTGKAMDGFINQLKAVEAGSKADKSASLSREFGAGREVFDFGSFNSGNFPKNANNKSTPKPTDKLMSLCNPSWDLRIVGTGDYDAYGKVEDVIMALITDEKAAAAAPAEAPKAKTKAEIKAENDRKAEELEGGAAVPSMGLSEFRGGDNALLEYTNVKRSGAYEGQGRSRKSMPPVTMRGGKHQRNGHALSEHLLAELGAPSHKKLLEGMMKHGAGIHGGGFFDDLRRGFESFGAKVKNEFVNPQSFLRTKVANEFTNPESVLRGKVLPVAARVGQFIAPALNAAVPGAGTAVSTGLSVAQGANQQAKNLGFGKRGCGKKKRAPASAGDGRRKRADIVRKVMAERGVKMIEASKIVKAEGLY